LKSSTNRSLVVMKKDENGAFIVVGLKGASDFSEIRNKNKPYNEENNTKKEGDVSK
jgi:hypothetical protein